MGKLTLLHINIIGAVVAIIVALGIWFTLITGAQDQRQQAETKEKAVADRADKAQTAAAALKKAQQDKVVATNEWRGYEATYIPVVGYSRFTGPTARVEMMRQLFWPNNGKSWPERYRRTIANYMNAERKRNGIVWVNPLVTAMAPFGPNPNTIEAAPGDKLGPVLHYSYDMQVTGKSLGSLINHIKGWPKITGAGIPVVDSVQVVGNSPNLTMTYRLTFTLILRDADVKAIPPEDPRVGGESGSGGGGFGGGMGMPGMMGMGGPRGMGGPMMSGGMMSGGMPGPPGGMGGPAMSAGAMGGKMGGAAAAP
jgi:hypothetical protein